MEQILWGVKKGNPSWMEEVIFEAKNDKELDFAKSYALSHGYTNLRVMNFNGEKPDFTKTIRK